MKRSLMRNLIGHRKTQMSTVSRDGHLL